MRDIPISAAKHIAKTYGYDQIIVIGRRCHDSPEPHGEHVTTYGRNRKHCDAAAKIGNYLKYKVFGWSSDTQVSEAA